MSEADEPNPTSSTDGRGSRPEPPPNEADEPTAVSSPLDGLGALAVQEKAVTDVMAHVEIYTFEGLLTLLWHGPRDAERVVLMLGGAMGGLLGPADGLFQDLGNRFAANGIGTVRVSYRVPNDLDRSVHDAIAVADLASRAGARRFVTVGHSFGGAVAVRAAIALGDHARGVVGLSTQSAGCEDADRLAGTPVLLFHGDRDELLPVATSEVVQYLSGGELEVLVDTGHLLREAGDHLRSRLGEWIPERLDDRTT